MRLRSFSTLLILATFLTLVTISAIPEIPDAVEEEGSFKEDGYEMEV